MDKRKLGLRMIGLLVIVAGIVADAAACMDLGVKYQAASAQLNVLHRELNSKDSQTNALQDQVEQLQAKVKAEQTQLTEEQKQTADLKKQADSLKAQLAKEQSNPNF